MTAARAARIRRDPAAVRSTPGRLRRRALAVAAIVLAAGAAPHAQATSPGRYSARAAAAANATASNSEIRLLVGRSAIINVTQPITRVSLTTPDVADALVTTPQQLIVHGKSPGTISLFVWDRTGGITTYEVVVERDLSALVAQVQQLFPGESIGVSGNGKDVVLSGTVSSKYVVEKAAEVATGYVEKKENVVNLLRQAEGVASNQVLLRVRFAEVSRSALQELGASFFSDGWRNKFGSSTTQQFAAPFFDQQEPMLGKSLIFSDYLNLFLFDAKNQLGAVIKALQTKGLFQSLAEPNLITQNGKEASFLAGGEYPYPAIQGSAGSLAVTVVFKEFGIRLNFTPTILKDDVIHLKVKPEVSALDFTNAVSIQGFRIPSLTTRRADTEVELRDGQTFAIAGLLNNTVTESMRKVPGIGDIPVLGMLFRSRALQKAETELVVMITPQIIRRNSTGVSPKLPDIEQPFLPPMKKPLPPPPPYVPQEREMSLLPQGAEPATAPVNAAAPTAPAPRAQGPRPAGSMPSPAPSTQIEEPAPQPAARTSSARPGGPRAPAQPAPAPSAPAPSAPAPPAPAQAVPADPRPAPRTPEPVPEPRLQPGPSADMSAPPVADQEVELADQPPQLTREQQEAIERARKQEKEQADAAERQRREDEKRAAREAKAALKKAQEDEKRAEVERREQERTAKERARREAQQAKKQAEVDKKRAKALAEANERFRAAQAEYEAQVKRAAKMGESGQPAAKPQGPPKQ
jgi:pilus assembly protein CpaC